MAIDLPAWQALEKRIDAAQVPDGLPLLDRLPVTFIESLEPLEALGLRYSPEAYLRPRQQPPAGDWLVWLMLAGRGFGKSLAAAGWLVSEVLNGTPDKTHDFALVAPVLDDCWGLQWRALKELIPPWVRYVERASRNQVLFPDHGVTLLMHSSEVQQYRGPNLRGAWCEEPVKWASGGAELWRNLRLAIRVKGTTPPRAVFTTTPPRELNWILELAAEESTVTTRGAMRDNPMLDVRAVDAAYRAMAGSIEGARELDGRVVLGTDGALFRVEDLEAARVQSAPSLQQIVIACDPAQSSRKDADTVGLVAVGHVAGHLYVLASCSERLEPAAWAQRAIEWARQFNAGRFVVEPTGSGSYPRATLEAQIRIGGTMQRPIIDSPARGAKADRAAPLSAAAAQGRLHLVGRHEQLERELLTWHPGANFSPGGLDALVHGAAAVTHNWTYL